MAHQPVSVAIEAGGREFQLYQSVSFFGFYFFGLYHVLFVFDRLYDVHTVDLRFLFSELDAACLTLQ